MYRPESQEYVGHPREHVSTAASSEAPHRGGTRAGNVRMSTRSVPTADRDDEQALFGPRLDRAPDGRASSKRSTCERGAIEGVSGHVLRRSTKVPRTVIISGQILDERPTALLEIRAQFRGFETKGPWFSGAADALENLRASHERHRPVEQPSMDISQRQAAMWCGYARERAERHVDGTLR